MSFRFQFRRGTTAERNASNPILAAGEPAVVLDSGQPAELVLGDGVTAMADLRSAVWDDDARLTDDRDPTVHTHTLADVTDAARKLRAYGPLGVLRRALEVGSESCALVVLGDSTSNGGTDWAYRFAQSLGERYPNWTIEHVAWDNTAQGYAVPEILQMGTDGPRSVATTLTSLSYLHHVGNGTAITGDLDVRVKLSTADWTPATTGTFAAKFGGAGLRSWMFQLHSTGVLQLTRSSDGTATTTASSTVATGLADGATKWVRCVLDVDNGSGGTDVKFYLSDDNVAWTQLGATVTTAGTTSLFNTTYEYSLGSRFSDSLAASFYEVEIRNGIHGLSVVPTKPDNWWQPGPFTVPVVVSGSPVLTMINGSVAGQGQAFFTDATRRPKLVPTSHLILALILSVSHNEGVRRGYDYWATWDTWLTAIRTRLAPIGSIVVSSQNPRVSPALNIREHATRTAIEAPAWARRNGLGFIDAYRAFMEDGREFNGVLLETDGVHPTYPIGSAVWRDAALAAFDNYE